MVQWIKRCISVKSLLWITVILIVLTFTFSMNNTLDSIITKVNLLMSYNYEMPNDMSCFCPNRTVTSSLRWSGGASSGPNSACDSYATSRGGHQNVVSYAFYGDVKGPYFKGIALNAELVTAKYPGWLMRVYHKLDMENGTVRDLLCPLWCQYHHLDFCQVTKLPAPLYNQSEVNPRVWRFNVLGDPLVDVFMSRDLDSLIGDREVAAVNEWLTSGRKWHFMHDNPYHIHPILAGLWGGHNRNLTLTTDIRQRLIEKSIILTGSYIDQDALTEVLLPVVESDGDYVNHDSFTCGGKPKNSSPWPVQRKSDIDFVGSAILRLTVKIVNECPLKCRPPTHSNWTYC